MNPIDAHGLKIAPVLFDFIAKEATPRTGVTPDAFWAGLAAIIRDLGPRNRELLAVRERCRPRSTRGIAPKGKPFDMAAYKAFLNEIGYLQPEPATRRGRDRQRRCRDRQHLRPAARRAADQRALCAQRRQCALGQPLRCALRHRRHSARGRARRQGLRPGARRQGDRQGQGFLDQAAPLASGAHATSPATASSNGQLAVKLEDGDATGRLKDPAQFAGYRAMPRRRPRSCSQPRPAHRDPDRPQPPHRQGRSGRRRRHASSKPPSPPSWTWRIASPRSMPRTRSLVYRNWLGLMNGTLADRLSRRAARRSTRRLNPDRDYTAPDGGQTDAARPQPDAGAQCRPSHDHRRRARRRAARKCRKACSTRVITACIAMHDLKGKSDDAEQPHRLGLYRQAEDARPGGGRLRRRAVRPRRGRCSACRATRSRSASWTRSAAPPSTSKACIAPPAIASCFINTGFLDRTGDEIHTSMEAGPMVRKGDMKAQPWIKAYEDWNVDIGLACGLPGQAQIGKGMWAAPDRMADMLAQKIGHPQGRRQHRLGAVADRRDAARPALPPGRRARRQEELKASGAARHAVRHPHHPGRRSRTGRPKRCSRNSTTTARAFSATWCAGSTRASAAPRCRTSTTSA